MQRRTSCARWHDNDGPFSCMDRDGLLHTEDRDGLLHTEGLVSYEERPHSTAAGARCSWRAVDRQRGADRAGRKGWGRVKPLIPYGLAKPLASWGQTHLHLGGRVVQGQLARFEERLHQRAREYRHAPPHVRAQPREPCGEGVGKLSDRIRELLDRIRDRIRERMPHTTGRWKHKRWGGGGGGGHRPCRAGTRTRSSRMCCAQRAASRPLSHSAQPPRRPRRGRPPLAPAPTRRPAVSTVSAAAPPVRLGARAEESGGGWARVGRQGA